MGKKKIKTQAPGPKEIEFNEALPSQQNEDDLKAANKEPVDLKNKLTLKEINFLELYFAGGYTIDTKLRSNE